MGPLSACSSGHKSSSTATSTTSTIPSFDDEVSSSTTARPTTTTTAAAARPLSAAVLKLADLPSGWSVAPEPSASRELCPGQDPSKAVPASTTADSSFEQGQGGPRLTSLLAGFRSPATAHSFLAASTSAIAACDTYEVSGVTYHLRPIAAPPVGDESLGAELSSDTTLGGGVHGQVLYVRVGSRVVTIVFGGTGNVDELVAARALRTVAARL